MGRVFEYSVDLRGRRWLWPGRLVAPPDRRTGFETGVSHPLRNTATGEGGPKTYGVIPVGSDGVCGWLADGHHYLHDLLGVSRSP